MPVKAGLGGGSLQALHRFHTGRERAQSFADLAESLQRKPCPCFEGFLGIVAAHHCLAICLRGLGIPAQSRVRFAEILVGSFFVRFHPRGEFQARHRLTRFAGPEQIDTEQQIGKVVFRLQATRALQERDGLSKPRLLMQIESLFQQFFEWRPFLLRPA